MDGVQELGSRREQGQAPCKQTQESASTEPAWVTGRGARHRPPGTSDVEKCPEGSWEVWEELVMGWKTLLQ